VIATVRRPTLSLPAHAGIVEAALTRQGKPKFDRVFDLPDAVSSFEGGACERSGQESSNRGLDDGRRRSSRGLVWRCDLAGAVTDYLEQNFDPTVGCAMGPVPRKNLGACDL
jgi:hypothetical protein